MIARLDLPARLLRLGIWLAAAFTYWWPRLSPPTQIEVAGMMPPPAPEAWTFDPIDGRVDSWAPILFILVALYFFWLGGPRSRGPSLLFTLILAGIALAAAMVGTVPPTEGWAIAPLLGVVGFLLTSIGILTTLAVRLRGDFWSKARVGGDVTWSTETSLQIGPFRWGKRHVRDASGAAVTIDVGSDGGGDGGGGGGE